MGSVTRLTVDVTRELLETGRVESTGRVRNFVRRAFFEQDNRVFVAPWHIEGALTLLVDEHGDLGVDLRGAALSAGDQLVFVASVDGDDGHAELHDGNAVFVLHVFARADQVTRDRLAGIELPSTARISDVHERGQWRKLREDVMELLIAQEAMGPASIEALRRYMATTEHELVFELGDGASIPAEELLDGWMRARYTRGRTRRALPQRGERSSFERDTAVDVVDAVEAFELPRLRRYEPVSAEPLLTMLEHARALYGDLGEQEAHVVASLLDDVVEATDLHLLPVRT